MEFENSFLNKTIMITGAGSDIGMSIANEFYKLGGNIILTDCEQMFSRLEQIKETMYSDKLGDIELMQLDLTNIEEVKEVAKNVVVDVLVNCAGRNIFVPILEVTEKIWDEIIDLNLKGTFFLTQLITSNMIEKKIQGKVINIGSQHGVVANGLRAPYCISKFGIVGMTKVFALELSIHKILVNCVSPTYVLTNKSKEFLSNDKVKMSYLPKIPLHKFAVPSDITHMVVFLASKYNTMITGENVLIDGGYTIH